MPSYSFAVGSSGSGAGSYVGTLTDRLGVSCLATGSAIKRALCKRYNKSSECTELLAVDALSFVGKSVEGEEDVAALHRATAGRVVLYHLMSDPFEVR